MASRGLDISRLTRDYGDPFREAVVCRERSCLFDFSFVERAAVQGPAALDLVGRLTSRDLRGLKAGQIRYTLHQDAEGILLSDLTVWCLGKHHYEVMSGRPEDIASLVEGSGPQARVDDLSTETAIFALQGPTCLQALRGLADIQEITRLAYFGHGSARIAGIDCRVGRLGYSGEPGIEIVLDQGDAAALWQCLAERAPPAGFAAADILRIEAGFALFANEFSLPVSAAEAGLPAFAGYRDEGRTPDIIRVCFQAQTSKVPILWQPPQALSRPRKPGELAVTSACHSPQAGGVLGMGYARSADIASGRGLYDAAGEFREIRLASLPFYDPEKRRPYEAWPTATDRPK